MAAKSGYDLVREISDRKRIVREALCSLLDYLQRTHPDLEIAFPKVELADVPSDQPLFSRDVQRWVEAHKLTTKKLAYVLEQVTDAATRISDAPGDLADLIKNSADILRENREETTPQPRPEEPQEKADSAVGYCLLDDLPPQPRPEEPQEKAAGPVSSGQIGSKTKEPAEKASGVTDLVVALPERAEAEDKQPWCNQEWLSNIFLNHSPEIAQFLKAQCDRGALEWYDLRQHKYPRYRRVEGFPQSLLHAISKPKPEGLGFENLFAHQVGALEALRAGKHLVVVTQTASGKTWCYNPAVFEAIVSQSGARAIFVFPLNALLIDQKEKIDQLSRCLTQKKLPVRAEAFLRGDFQRLKDVPKDPPDILTTNPEFLSLLIREAEKGELDWSPFLRNVRYVVLDEVHTYRGLLGMHMAGLLRRLLLLCRRAEANPQFVLSSATVTNPLDLATRLTSLEPTAFTLLDEDDDGSEQWPKHWIILDSVKVEEEANFREWHLAAAATVFTELLCGVESGFRSKPLNTIVFAKSFREVNRIYELAQRKLQEQRPDLLPKVEKYASAMLTPQQKRKIYDALQNETLHGVVSTNALEAGIDIPKLDACIIAGFPFTVMRMRQMAGRVGRRKEGLVVFIPSVFDPVDQYYREHPGLLLAQPPESYVIDHNNRYIMRRHLNAAAATPSGITLDEARIFGPKTEAMLHKAQEDRKIFCHDGRYRGTHIPFDRKDDYVISNIRARQQEPYILCGDATADCRQNQCDRADQDADRNNCKTLVGLLDRQYVYRDCHPGAVYRDPNGGLHQVRDLDDKNRIVRLHRLTDDDSRRTFADEETTVDILGTPSGERNLPLGAKLAWGTVKVVRSYAGYYSYNIIRRRRCRRCRVEFEEEVKVCPHCGHRTREYQDQTKPEPQRFPPPHQDRVFSLSLDTVAVWLVLDVGPVVAKLERISPCKLPDIDNAVHQFLLKPLRPIQVVNADEHKLLEEYHRLAGPVVRRAWQGHPNDTVVFPGVFQNCLRHWLSSKLPEDRAKGLYELVTGYPVTSDQRHVCFNCRAGMLLPALHTLEHTVLSRYPGVALGDADDLASHTVLAHAQAGGPTIFWYDNFDGGLGAAEKVFERFDDLLQHSVNTVRDCPCKSRTGCPHCTHISRCDRRNDPLDKLAGRTLASLLAGGDVETDFEPIIVRGDQRAKLREESKRNEQAAMKKPVAKKDAGTSTPANQVLRVQPRVHSPVLDKALDVRANEIRFETPAISETALYDAYNRMRPSSLQAESWTISPEMTPQQVLELLESASPRMIKAIYRVLAGHFHPDRNPNRIAWADQMMKLINRAYEHLEHKT